MYLDGGQTKEKGENSKGERGYRTCCLLPEEGMVTVWHEAVDIVDEMLQYSSTTYVMLCLFLFSLLLVPVPCISVDVRHSCLCSAHSQQR